jgi:HK97 family phage major capsid protein/HK97 family phage prohead protease
MLNRAYSLLSIKQVDEDARVITGMASTPTPDRLEDVVEPTGAQFKLPLPLLWQHDSKQPIGQVTHAKVTKAGIEIVAKIAKGVTAEIDRAWSLIKAGLVPGLSIGFKPIEHEFITETKGIRFTKWDFLELSAVTIPANSECTIATVKSIDTAQRAASGQAKPRPVVHLNPPGASGSSQPKSAQEGAMKTIAEQITALEAKRTASAARMEAVMQKTLDEDRTSDAAEQEEFDSLQGTVEALDKDLVRLRQVEKTKALAAKPVTKAEKAEDGAAMRGGSIVVRTPPKLGPGIGFVQRIRAEYLSHRQYRPAGDIAAELYGPDSPVTMELMTKANVVAGSTITGNWAANLVSAEGATSQDFIEWLRPQTILGRFGIGGVPSMRSVMFNVPMVQQTAGGAGYWVGEGKAKPLTSFNFARLTLPPLKVANICVLTMESIRFSSPKSDTIVRDQLAAALRERLDLDFITPSKTAVAGVSPASITNGAPSIVSSGDDADAVRLDIRSLIAKYMAANNPPTSGVFIMGSNVAAALTSMTNPLGQAEFAGMSMTGGILFGFPVITSDYVPAAVVVLVNAADIYLADDGEITIDSSNEASLEMSDAPTGSSITPTATQLVSMYQTNSVAIRAERVINWLRRRTPSVAYLTSADWGGPVHTA